MATCVGLMSTVGRQVFSCRAVASALRLSRSISRTNVRLYANFFAVSDDVCGLTDHEKQVLVTLRGCSVDLLTDSIKLLCIISHLPTVLRLISRILSEILVYPHWRLNVCCADCRTCHWSSQCLGCTVMFWLVVLMKLITFMLCTLALYKHSTLFHVNCHEVCFVVQNIMV
jgi:hypothetical protein